MAGGGQGLGEKGWEERWHVSPLEVHQEAPGDADEGSCLHATCSTALGLPPASHPWEVCPSQSHFVSPRRAAQASIHRWLLVTPGV